MHNDYLRGLLVEYASISAEIADQLHSRATILQRQIPLDAEIRDPRTLPVSDYLRSANRTDYVQLFDWLQGAEPAQPGKLSSAERIRMAQRLTADAYWQKVNEVYASGQGEVAMAFIKDDLGNWDLKSFSNDPSELLAAYRQVANAALKTAVSLTQKAATGGVGSAAGRIGEARKAADFANQLATGERSATPGVVAGVNIAALHDRAAARIVAQKARFKILEDRLTSERDAGASAARDADDKRTKDRLALANDRDALATAVATRDSRSEQLVLRMAELNAEKARIAALTSEERADTTDTTDTKQQAVASAKTAVAEAQIAVDAAQVKAARSADVVAQDDRAKSEADAKEAAAEQRLTDLPKEAIEAVRGALDDHLAVVASLQEGISPPAAQNTGPGSSVPAPPGAPP